MAIGRIVACAVGPCRGLLGEAPGRRAAGAGGRRPGAWFVRFRTSCGVTSVLASLDDFGVRDRTGTANGSDF